MRHGYSVLQWKNANQAQPSHWDDQGLQGHGQSWLVGTDRQLRAPPRRAPRSGFFLGSHGSPLGSGVGDKSHPRGGRGRLSITEKKRGTGATGTIVRREARHRRIRSGCGWCRQWLPHQPRKELAHAASGLPWLPAFSGVRVQGRRRRHRMTLARILGSGEASAQQSSSWKPVESPASQIVL